MDKHSALKILIQHTYLFSPEVKSQLLNKLPELTTEEVQSLGNLLANEKKTALTKAPQRLASLEELQSQLKKKIALD